MDHLSAGREAIARFAWADALSAFAAAELEEPLSPEDIVQKAGAQWWGGDVDGAVDALEQAHGGFVEQARNAEAANVALRLAELAARRFSIPVAKGWLARAERLLADEPESPVRARLLALNGILAFLIEGAFGGAQAQMERALALARHHHALDVEALLLAFMGHLLVRQGRWTEGMAALDEAAATAAAGRLDPLAVCDVYCQTITTCSAIGEYRRAADWIERADRWMQARAIKGYRGMCRVHRAELKRIGGEWAEAEAEARIACDELRHWRLLDGVGMAQYEIGEVRLAMGDLQGAEAAFATAHEYGRTPQPGLALLLLARGDVEQATESIARALAPAQGGKAVVGDVVERTRLLPAQVEVALAAGDLAKAGEAAAALADMAASHDSDAIRAPALTARGAVELASGASAAAATLDSAWRLWQELDMPFESARARTLLGRALAAAGDDAAARLEWRAARSVFERLGAARDLRLVTALLEQVGEVDQRRLTKTFLFSDIVTSTDLVRLIGDAAWNELIAWHDRTLREAFADHAGVEVRHTGDGFFVSFDDAAAAVRCAVAIQRRLKSHRHQHGFAPLVRIGLHSAEASPHGADFAGHGVHVAARVAAEAQGEEILASSSVIETAGPLGLDVSQVRTVSLKGVSEPVEVGSVAWE